jgi:hypothetical protein
VVAIRSRAYSSGSSWSFMPQSLLVVGSSICPYTP